MEKSFFSQVAAAKAEFAELFAAAEVTSQKLDKTDLTLWKCTIGRGNFSKIGQTAQDLRFSDTFEIGRQAQFLQDVISQILRFVFL